MTRLWGCPSVSMAPKPVKAKKKRRPSTTWWLGRSLPNLATHVAIFARNRVSARNADHTLTDIPWAAAGGKCLISSATTRTMISDTAVARSARNCAKKGDRKSFHGFWPFLGEKGFVCCRVFGIASPGCPRPRRRLSVLHEDARALTVTDYKLFIFR